MTFRAVKVLNEVDFICSEDTRRTGLLLKHFGIEGKLRSYHKFNEHKIVKSIAKDIAGGKTAALVSDAGTPAISDPGFLLVRECIQMQLKVECLPGATAFLPALVNSGLPSEKFVFEGFLPQKKGRQKRLKQLAEEERTLVFYESPYRVLKALKQFAELFGADRQVSVSREISKMYEETRRGNLSELIQYYETENPKGEFVIVVGGKS